MYTERMKGEREKETHRESEGGVHREMRALEAVELKRTRVHHLSTSVENEDLPQVAAAPERWRELKKCE
jgi:hypothetical protein